MFSCHPDPTLNIRTSDDHVARIFPAVYPEIFDISKDSIAPAVGADENEAAYVTNLWAAGENIWKKHRRAKPVARSHDERQRELCMKRKAVISYDCVSMRDGLPRAHTLLHGAAIAQTYINLMIHC